MMRKLFYLGTVAFWVAVAAIWQGGETLPPPAPAPATLAAAPAERRIGLAEIARHNRPGDCWTAINGQVYDLSAYAAKPPSRPAIAAAACGREASRPFQTTDRRRSPARDADTLLADFRIGPQAEP